MSINSLRYKCQNKEKQQKMLAGRQSNLPRYFKQIYKRTHIYRQEQSNCKKIYHVAFVHATTTGYNQSGDFPSYHHSIVYISCISMSSLRCTQFQFFFWWDVFKQVFQQKTATHTAYPMKIDKTKRNAWPTKKKKRRECIWNAVQLWCVYQRWSIYWKHSSMEVVNIFRFQFEK